VRDEVDAVVRSIAALESVSFDMARRIANAWNARLHWSGLGERDPRLIIAHCDTWGPGEWAFWDRYGDNPISELACPPTARAAYEARISQLEEHLREAQRYAKHLLREERNRYVSTAFRRPAPWMCGGDPEPQQGEDAHGSGEHGSGEHGSGKHGSGGHGMRQ
jgi:hypothetical protein